VAALSQAARRERVAFTLPKLIGRAGTGAALTVAISMCSGNGASQPAGTLAERRLRMVEEQIARRGIRDARVLGAMRKVERHLFLPESHWGSAYDDHPLPIGEGQTISQPYIVALMTEALRLQGKEKVLEVGTGSGYQTAILAELAGYIYSLEYFPSLAEGARKILAQLGYRNVEVRVGDGNFGWPEHAPFDAILVAAAPAEVPRPLLEQLRDGGRLVIPVGTDEQELELHTRRGDRFTVEKLGAVRFVPLLRDTKQ
jgi:protein-L-isoaspartate(D-aspartate) O-methyltransferase